MAQAIICHPLIILAFIFFRIKSLCCRLRTLDILRHALAISHDAINYSGAKQHDKDRPYPFGIPKWRCKRHAVSFLDVPGQLSERNGVPYCRMRQNVHRLRTKWMTG